MEIHSIMRQTPPLPTERTLWPAIAVALVVLGGWMGRPGLGNDAPAPAPDPGASASLDASASDVPVAIDYPDGIPVLVYADGERLTDDAPALPVEPDSRDGAVYVYPDGTRRAVATVDAAVRARPAYIADNGDAVYVYPDGCRVPVNRVVDGDARWAARMGWGRISLSALADGVNPCAFATIVMLVSMMATARRTRRETVVIGVSFTFAVFVAYMAIGWALYDVFQRLGAYRVLSDVVYLAAFLVCVVCGLLSLWDAWIIHHKKDASAMTLQLPKGFKRRIQKALSTGVRSSRLAAGTFVAGLLVSGIEAACTGQVFFPFIAGIKDDDPEQALVKLAWYCLLFVLPLIVVFVLALSGVSNQQFADWMKRHMVATKLALAAVFVLMGLVLWEGVKWPPGSRAGDGIAAATRPAPDNHACPHRLVAHEW